MRKVLSRIVFFVVAFAAIYIVFTKAGSFLRYSTGVPMKAVLIVVVGGDVGARSLVSA